MAHTCELVDLEAQPTLVIRTRASIERLPEVLGPAWGAIMAHGGAAGAQPAGPMFVAYHNMDMRDLDIEIGCGFDHRVAGDGEVRPGEIPAGRAAECLHVGPYAELGAAHQALGAWMAQHGLQPAGPAYEFYVNDPADTAPADLETRIVIPVR